jgi:hypothetical protein
MRGVEERSGSIEGEIDHSGTDSLNEGSGRIAKNKGAVLDHI